MSKERFEVQPYNNNGEKDGTPLAEQPQYVSVLPEVDTELTIIGDDGKGYKRVTLQSYFLPTLSVKLHSATPEGIIVIPTVMPTCDDRIWCPHVMTAFDDHMW